MNQENVRKYIAVIERAVNLLKAELGAEEAPPAAPEVTVAQAPPSPAHLSARAKHVQSLMDIDCWPQAVPPHLIASTVSDEDQINRANSVFDMMLMKSIEGKNFLDFGCGDGWIAREAVRRGAAFSMGYDIQGSEQWQKMSGVQLTTKYSEVPTQHFDVVFIYDVLDHCHDPMLLMTQIRSVAKKGAIIYIRCHPWTSKHASHLYKVGLNKSYIHLFLTTDELVGLGYQPFFTRPEKNPLEAYHWWFHEFKMIKERTHRQPLHEFFLVPAFVDLLINEQRLEGERRDGFFKDMEIDFVDYVLQI